MTVKRMPNGDTTHDFSPMGTFTRAELQDFMNQHADSADMAAATSKLGTGDGKAPWPKHNNDI